MKITRYLLLLILLISSFSCKNNKRAENNTQTYSHAAVVSASDIASKVGVEIMKKGGNAVDAAVAVSFALAVVYPSAGNIGGGGFMVLRLANGETNALDFREKAPAGASGNMYLDSSGNVIPGLSLLGHKACGVPGTVDGMFRAHEKYGKLSWDDLVQPAVDLARNGFRLSKIMADDLNAQHNDFIKYNPDVSYLLSDGTWKEGDVLKQEDLANTLELIKNKGRDGFYEGMNAYLVATEMERGNGLITKEDLHNYQSVWRKPVTGSYRGYDIISMPPPSSGGIALMQLLKMVEPYPLSQWGFHSVKTVHLMTEAENRVYADRAKWLGDPDFFSVPVSQLLDSVYIVKRISGFDANHATPASAIHAGEMLVTEKEETTHFSIVDSAGNAVAVTYTLNGSYGSKVFVKGAGFLLNNEMDDFSMKPGVANAYGLVGGEANAIAPDKRMLSSMTPTIITKDGKLYMVVGTPGGSTIITTVFQTILNVIDFKMNMQQAVDASRFHSQWLPDEVATEQNALDSTITQALKAMGHNITPRGAIGRCDAILVLPNHLYETGADKRGEDRAEGW